MPRKTTGGTMLNRTSLNKNDMKKFIAIAFLMSMCILPKAQTTPEDSVVPYRMSSEKADSLLIALSKER